MISMKTFTVRHPDSLAADIEAEARKQRISKSDVARERLAKGRDRVPAKGLADIADLIGSVVDDMPTDLSARKRHYLRTMGFGRNRSG